MNELTGQIVIVPFSKIDSVGAQYIGTKADHLGTLLKHKIPVPNGFAITILALERFLRSNNLVDFIQEQTTYLDPHDSSRLENISKKIRRKMLRASLDNDLADIIMRTYGNISGFTDSYVAIRSSLPSENFQQDEVAGQFYTKLNIKGKEEVVQHVKECWASLYTPQNLFYFTNQGLDISSIRLGIIVQKMIQSEVSGIMFTLNPLDNDTSKISIEAVLGLGEVLVHGQVTPDTYLLDKKSNEVLEKHIIPQDWMLVRKGKTKKKEDPNVKVNVGTAWHARQKLDNKYLIELAKIGKKIEEIFNEPQHIEWAYESGKLWVVQARKVQTLKIDDSQEWKKTPTFAAIKAKVSTSAKAKKEITPKKREKKPVKNNKEKKQQEEQKPDHDLRVILTGVSAQIGTVSAPAKIVNSIKDQKNVQGGEIIILKKLTPAHDEILKHVVGIITDENGRDSHAAMMAQRLGIPCIVGTQVATDVINDGEMVTINGNTGEVFLGVSEEGEHTAQKILQVRYESKETVKAIDTSVPIQASSEELKPVNTIQTATKVFATITDETQADLAMHNGADGIATIQSNALIQDIGMHPQLALKNKSEGEVFVNNISKSISYVANRFSNKPVIYALNDMTQKQLASLRGGSDVETFDPDTSGELRGTSRYIEYPDEVRLELEAVKYVRNKENMKNIWLAIPFVRTYNEIKEVKKIISSFGFKRSSTFKLIMMVEIPTVVFRIEKMLDIGIDGVIIDTDDLTQLMLGVNTEVNRKSKLYRSSYPGIISAIETVVETCSKHNIKSYISGKLVSDDTKALEKCIDWGATGVTVHPDMISHVRNEINDAEKKLLFKRKKK